MRAISKPPRTSHHYILLQGLRASSMCPPSPREASASRFCLKSGELNSESGPCIGASISASIMLSPHVFYYFHIYFSCVLLLYSCPHMFYFRIYFISLFYLFTYFSYVLLSYSHVFYFHIYFSYVLLSFSYPHLIFISFEAYPYPQMFYFHIYFHIF